MPPIVALTACTAFILYLFRFDAKEGHRGTPALWIPFAWVLIIASRYVSQWVRTDLDTLSVVDVEAGSPLDRFIFSALICLGLIVLFKKKDACLHVIKNNKWILFWFFYCAVSIFWSDFPAIAVKRLIKGIGTFIMVLVILTEPDPVQSFRTLIRRAAYVLIPLSIVLIKYYRSYGVSYNFWEGNASYTGVTDNKNTLGRLCLVTGLFFFWTLAARFRTGTLFSGKKELFINLLFFGMIGWLLYKAHSATSLGGLLIGIASYTALGMPLIRKNVRSLGILIIAAVCVFAVLQWSFNITEEIVTLMGRNMTLTDRTLLWADLLSTDRNPLFGTGYDSFWLGERLEQLWNKYWWKPNESHNGYLEIYLELGLVGLGFLAGLVLTAYRNIRKSLPVNPDFGRYRMAFLVIILLYNITESAFKGVNLLWFIFLFTALDFSGTDALPGPVPRPGGTGVT